MLPALHTEQVTVSLKAVALTLLWIQTRASSYLSFLFLNRPVYSNAAHTVVRASPPTHSVPHTTVYHLRLIVTPQSRDCRTVVGPDPGAAGCFVHTVHLS